MPNEGKKGSIEVGRRLKQRRKVLKWTQQKVADDLGISTSHYIAVENGRRDFSKDLLIRMSNLFEVSTDYLLLGKINTGNSSDDMIKAINELSDQERYHAHEIMRHFLEAMKMKNSE